MKEQFSNAIIILLKACLFLKSMGGYLFIYFLVKHQILQYWDLK